MAHFIFLCFHDDGRYLHSGGGKDRVEFYIERSKDNIIAARDSLATIMKILDLNKV